MLNNRIISIINSTLRLETEYSEKYSTEIACTEIYSLDEIAELEEMFYED
jgi:hypothetical protein